MVRTASGVTVSSPFDPLRILKGAVVVRGTAVLAEIEAFVGCGQATGALLDAEADRAVAQSELDYWSTRLYQIRAEPLDSTLAEFDPLLAPELDEALCPYLGLDAFREDHRAVFFGRARLIGELIDKLQTVRLLAVVGSSGSGKSSVVHAGLMPALRAGALPGSEAWSYFPSMVPGSNPLANLARLPPPAAAVQIQHEVARYVQDADHLAQLIAARSSSPGVLVIDQFEEAFTLCADDVTRRRFVENLIGLSRQSGAEHRIIITMRADFESNVARLEDFQPVFEQGLVRVMPLNARELREAIEAPAALIGLKFEEGVVEALLNDTLGEPAALPLLQFTLLRLWESRERNRVTWEAYRRLALAKTADDFYNRLIPEERITVQRLLLKMVRPGAGLEVTSNRVPRVSLYYKAEARDRIDRALAKLIKARLVRVSDEQVEVAHEALVRNWPRLVEWLEEDRAALRQRQRLTAAAEQWQRLDRDPAAVWRGKLLDEARHYADLTQLEMDFILVGRAADRAERQLEETRKQQELEYARQLAEVEKKRADEQTRLAVYLMGAVGMTLLLGLVAGVFGVQSKSEANGRATAEANAVVQRDEAQRQARIAFSHQLAAQSISHVDNRFDLALLLSIEASLVTDTVEARNSLLTGIESHPGLIIFLRGHADMVRSVAFSPDGKTCEQWPLEPEVTPTPAATLTPVPSTTPRPLPSATSALPASATPPWSPLATPVLIKNLPKD